MDSLGNNIVRLLALMAVAMGGFFGFPAQGNVKVAPAAQAYGAAGQPVQALPSGSIHCEAEEFQVQTPGWQAQEWGENYYAATFANTFLSRKAFLGAPAQCEPTAATRRIEVPKAGRYLALVRYEAVYRFETQFRLRIIQNGETALDRLYGARDNVKIWAFGQKLKKEVAWSWGAVENVVWEGHDAYVELEAGPATLELIAGPQPGLPARRNVDLVMLTPDEAEVQRRIDGENYLPLDGLLTQSGDVYLRLHNQPDGSPMTLKVPPATEHSPYWVHIRNWEPRELTAEAGESTDWVEVGSLLDCLSDGQWKLGAAPRSEDAPLHYQVEFGVRMPQGNIEPMGTFESRAPEMELAYDANTRYTRRIRRSEEILYDLLAYLKAHPVRGQVPRRTLIVCYTFDERPEDPQYMAARREFIEMMGLTGLMEDAAIPNGYRGAGGSEPEQVEAACRELQEQGGAENIAVVTLGDEIGLESPPAEDHEGFRQWLRDQGLQPSDVDPAADAWDQVVYSPEAETASENPTRFYYSQRYRQDYGIRRQKALTDVLRRYLPNAGIGANYSPHHPHRAYLGEVHKWVTLFRRDGMTQPWSEDYIWQLPLGSQQMNFINLDLFRTGLKGKPEGKIHYYVMPHSPGNTPNSWRRQFYGDVAHGMKVVNLFEFRPVQAAYTENHTSFPEMYREVRTAFYEMGRFEDLMQEGQVRPGQAALWFSETGDIWDNVRNPFAAAKRALYIAVLHQGLQTDCFVEQDAPDGGLAPYKVLYLTERNVSRAASQALSDWVATGGRLLATAGAGMRDEFNQPNGILQALLGVEETSLEVPEGQSVQFIKQDLPFVEPFDTVTWRSDAGAVRIPVLGVRSRFQVTEAQVVGRFGDGSPAVTVRQEGEGTVIYCGFLPGLAYFQPAIPRRPVDRGATDKAMSHFIPTDFHAGASHLIGWPARGLTRAVVCSEPLVEAKVKEAAGGVLIPLINWSGGPVRPLTVRVSMKVPSASVELASGKPVRVSTEGETKVFTLDLNVADALILR